MKALQLVALLVIPVAALAQSTEDENTCLTTTDDPCFRSGTCNIQGAVWHQDVTIDRADIFDTMGWPGLCDMVHVGLVQGDCEPAGGQTNVFVYLSATSFAFIDSISGPLDCAADSLATDSPEAARLNKPLSMSAGPNPFSEAVLTRFTLPRTSTTVLTVHDASGRLKRRLIDTETAHGTHMFWWDGRDDSGAQLPAGIYFLRLRVRTEAKTLKIVKLAD